AHGCSVAAGKRVFIVSPSLLSRCGVRSPPADAGKAPVGGAGGGSPALHWASAALGIPWVDRRWSEPYPFFAISRQRWTDREDCTPMGVVSFPLRTSHGRGA